MKNQKTDNLMRRVLLDALRLEWSEYLENTPPVDTSERYRHEMQKMLADPLAWHRRKIRPLWKKTLRVAAVAAIIFSIAFGGLMIASPDVRAEVWHWVVEWYDTHVVYRYTGEPIQGEMPRYEIGSLPEGYEEAERREFSNYVSVIYKNTLGETLYLDYSFMKQGSALNIVTQDMDVHEVKVNGCSGQLFISKSLEESNAITWIDIDRNIQFIVNGFLDEEEILNVAESVFEK